MIFVQLNLFKRLNPPMIASVSHDVLVTSRMHFVSEMAQELAFMLTAGIRHNNIYIAAADITMFLRQQLAQGENG